MRMLPTVILCLTIIMTTAFGAAVEIISFENGQLTWTNSQVAGTATIQWSPDLLQDWVSNWETLTDIPITGNVMTVDVPMFFRVVQRTYAPLTNVLAEIPYSAADKQFYLVNSNQYPNGYNSYQKDGPEYAFYMSVFEISNVEFCDFLNDAEINQSNEKGAHMFFTSDGDVYMDSTESYSELLFRIGNSRLQYALGSPVGRRYSIVTDSPVGGGSYSNHPVHGVLWYGAVKYCNWRTIQEGRGNSQRCYSEGTNPPDWAPVTAVSWDLGIFSDTERSNLLEYAGFRLPMDGEGRSANLFNEFYKAAGWNGTTNTDYGFGRDVIGGRDANYEDSGDPFDNDTTPIGYYDGSTHGGSFTTRSNENAYGLFDLSGGVEEWMTDFASSGSVDYRVLRGGSWAGDSDDCLTSRRRNMPPNEAGGFADEGFRIVSTQQ